MRARTPITRSLYLEPLEARLALAAGFASLDEAGVLQVVGTHKGDRIAVSLEGAEIVVHFNGARQEFESAAVSGLRIDAGGGNDRIEVASAITLETWIDGGSGNDRIQGGSGDDELFGGKGNDDVRGGAGNDLLNGDAGNDKLSGDAGDDELLGGDGADKLLGHTGNDLLTGDAGSDVLRGGEGDDTLGGGAGHDSLFGDYGLDWLDGGDGNDLVAGGGGDDKLKGGAGNDNLNGNAGENLLDGDTGKDNLKNGTVVDLDVTPEPEFQPLLAELSGSSLAFGQAVYERQSSGTQVETFLHIVVNGLALNASFDVVVDGVLIGQLVTDGDGWGELRFSTLVDEPGELPLPTDPKLAAGVTIQIGTELGGVFVLT